jgi:hypothetical protein
MHSGIPEAVRPCRFVHLWLETKKENEDYTFIKDVFLMKLR